MDMECTAVDRVEDPLDRVIRDIKHSVDLTMIFNQHGDGQDAETSTENIEPESVVFIEGFSSTKGMTAPYSDNLELLSLFKTFYGTDYAEYQGLKQAILKDITRHAMAPCESYKDFTPHSLRTIQLLLEKDCTVRYADHVHLAENESNPSRSSFLSSTNKIFANATLDTLKDVDSNANTAKAIVAIYKGATSQYAKSDLRERFAFANFVQHFETIFQAPDWQNNLNLTDEGKIKTYIMYGTAHADSLSTKFDTEGILSKRIMLDDVPEHTFLERSPRKFHENLQRRVAFSAISSLSYRLDSSTTEIEYDTKRAAIYENLAPLNESQHTTLAFLIQCIQIKQLSEANTDAARQWYDDVVRQTITTQQFQSKH